MRLPTALTLCLLTFVSAVAIADDSEPFVVHEWGTFTVLQQEDGTVLPGVNINEEPLPEFTHRLFPGLVKGGRSHDPLQRFRSKGLPSNFADATMRMETPIIYIYPPDGDPTKIDVRVQFQGGWISEWYPNAQVSSPGFDAHRRDLGKLSRDSQGSITWNNLTINSDRKIPATNEHVWLAPRDVQTPTLHTEGGQAEKYLFYRGVGNIEAPLRIRASADKQQYNVVRNHSLGKWEEELAFKTLWLVDITRPGMAAYRRIEVRATSTKKDVIAATAATFDKESYSEGNLDRLKSEMKEALVAEGLYSDEADAMLKTWELSYFHSTGTRFFFTLPREWTDRVLPMEVSRESKIERVMMGRIELITQYHRELLKVIASGPTSNANWYWQHLSSLNSTERASIHNSLVQGTKEIADLGFDIPDDYKAYVQLGRFRESIVANAITHESGKRLREFANNYRIALR